MSKNLEQKSPTSAILLERLVMCTDRLPVENGEYKILNNSGCNNGEGRMNLVDGEWDIPDAIKSFYKVIGWYEYT